MTSHALHLLRRLSFIHIVILYIPISPLCFRDGPGFDSPFAMSFESGVFPRMRLSPLDSTSFFPLFFCFLPDYLSPILFSLFSHNHTRNRFAMFCLPFLTPFLVSCLLISVMFNNIRVFCMLFSFIFFFFFSVWT